MNRRSKFICKNFLLLIAAMLVWLLFYCIISEAVEAESEELYSMPTAGFEEFIEEIQIPSAEEIRIPSYPPIEESLDKQTLIEPSYYITDQEADLLLRIGVLEGGGSDVDSIANCMQVIMNRVESDAFPNSVEEVIFQKNPVQFTTADKLATANITPEAYAALDAVIFGDYQDNQCHFFESCEGLAFEKWADYSFSYGGHDFYKVKEGVV